MERFISVLAALLFLSASAKGATGLSSALLTNFNQQHFQVDLTAAPTNIIKISSNVIAGLLWTNKGGILQPTDLALPVEIDSQITFGPGMTNALYRDGSDLVYSNAASTAYFYVIGTSPNRAGFGNVGGHSSVLADSGGVIYLSPNQGVGGDVVVTSVSLTPDVETKSLGNSSSTGAWTNQWFKGTLYQQGMNDGFGNYSRLAISQADTNSPVVFNLQTSGTAGDPVGFAFQTNGVTLFTINGTGVEMAGTLIVSGMQWIAPQLVDTSTGAVYVALSPSVVTSYIKSGIDYPLYLTGNGATNRIDGGVVLVHAAYSGGNWYLSY